MLTGIDPTPPTSAGFTGYPLATFPRRSSTRPSYTPPRTNVRAPSPGCSNTAPTPTPVPTKASALHLAAAFGALECARLLIAAGADIDRPNDFNGDNAVGWAQYVLEQERPGDPRVIAVRDFLRSLGSVPLVWGVSSH
jgi:hypothetical protein